MHIDTNFVPLNDNTLMLNPKRPPRPWVLRLLRENGWKTIIGTSNGIPTHPLSHCSEWLSCNVLSIDEKVSTAAVEERKCRRHHRCCIRGSFCLDDLPYTEAGSSCIPPPCSRQMQPLPNHTENTVFSFTHVSLEALFIKHTPCLDPAARCRGGPGDQDA